MRTQFLTVLITVVSLLVSGRALAQPAEAEIQDFQPGQVLRARELNAIVRQLNLNTKALNRESGATHAVDCSSTTITGVLSTAQPGDTIKITGTCSETVIVNKDGVTLDGGGTAIIDGGGADVPVIAVYGQRNVVIRGLTVQNGGRGVLADRGAAVWLEDVTARDNHAGITISGNSNATLAGAILANDNKPEVGIDLHQSTIWAQDVMVQANRNAADGIALHRGAQMFLIGASQVEAKANGYGGILCYLECSVSVVSSSGTAISIQVTDNAGIGIYLYSNAHFLIEGVDLTVRDNGGDGLLVANASSIETFGGFNYGDTVVPSGAAVFSNNGNDGISLSRNSHAAFYSPVTISNNGGAGISARNGVDVNLASNDATVTGNADGDVEIALGSRLGWGEDTTIGTVSCDNSVLTYGDAACP